MSRKAARQEGTPAKQTYVPATDLPTEQQPSRLILDRDYVCREIFLFKLERFVRQNYDAPLIDNVISVLINETATNGRCHLNRTKNVENSIKEYISFIRGLNGVDYDTLIEFIEQVE